MTTHRIARMVDQLGAAVPIRADDCPRVPKKPGLYMFTEDGRAIKRYQPEYQDRIGRRGRRVGCCLRLV